MKLKNYRNHADGGADPTAAATAKVTYTITKKNDSGTVSSYQLKEDLDFLKGTKEATVVEAADKAVVDKDVAAKNNKKLYIGIAVVLVAVAFAWWYLKKS